MKKYYTIFFFILTVAPFSFTQHDFQCVHISDSEPIDFGPVTHLPNIKQRSVREIPIVIHQYSHWNDLQVMGLVNHLNFHFSANGLPITFTLCNFIDFDTIIDFSTVEISNMAETTNIPNAVNIYVTNSIGATTRTSDVTESWIGISRFDPTTIVHEMGHYFRLKHTHSSSSGAELVDGSNCSTAGDGFCDTPADPNLSNETNNMCQYVGTDVDANGDVYHPDPTNFMSYSQPFCKTKFSEEQKQFMLNTIDQLYSEYACGTTSTLNVSIRKNFILYPNPSNGMITFDVQNFLHPDEFDVFIYNTMGEMVLSVKSKEGQQIDLNRMSEGLYFVQLQMGELTLTKSFVLQ